MKKIKSFDYSDEDTQQCLKEINKNLSALNIEEKDVISVHYQWNEKPIKIHGTKDANVTLTVFYWE